MMACVLPDTMFVIYDKCAYVEGLLAFSWRNQIMDSQLRNKLQGIGLTCSAVAILYGIVYLIVWFLVKVLTLLKQLR